MSTQNPIVRWPFGEATVEKMTASGDQSFEVVNDLTIIDGASVVATADRSIELTIDAELKPGARIIVKSKTTATEKTQHGTGITAADITGVAGKTKVAEYVYDGSNFIATGSPVQID